MELFDKTIKDVVCSHLGLLEKHFDADVIFFYGPIQWTCDKYYKELLEGIKKDSPSKDRIVIFLNTPGGIVEVAEKLVIITRYHYKEVFFVVPDYAMSAGTVFCMSGDRIYMDYSSTLGPIDPQLSRGNDLIPALGYLDKVNEFVEKSRQNTITPAEFALLKELDLGTLRSYEQARDLTIQLIKDWLVRYKFKNWNTHKTNPAQIGEQVTAQEKEQRAAEIAIMLGDNKVWHSHGRCIDINKLKYLLRLEIDDYSNDSILKPLIRNYNDTIISYITRMKMNFFLNSRSYF